VALHDAFIITILSSLTQRTGREFLRVTAMNAINKFGSFRQPISRNSLDASRTSIKGETAEEGIEEKDQDL
jgi:hypothetical protein